MLDYSVAYCFPPLTLVGLVCVGILMGILFTVVVHWAVDP